MSNTVTPFMAQYLEIKSRNPETLLFFRMGDFYELFFEDAEIAADVLDITLTKRGQHKGDPIPMAGVPHHSAEPYLARLIRAGHCVAICEQTETPEEAKKRGSKAVVNRDIVRIVTPGTLTEETRWMPAQATIWPLSSPAKIRNPAALHLPIFQRGASLSCRLNKPVLPPRLLDIIQASWSSQRETMTRVAFAARCRRLDLHSQHTTRDLRARKVGRKPWHLLSV